MTGKCIENSESEREVGDTKGQKRKLRGEKQEEKKNEREIKTEGLLGVGRQTEKARNRERERRRRGDNEGKTETEDVSGPEQCRK